VLRNPDGSFVPPNTYSCYLAESVALRNPIQIVI
jgi:hypothetical protein